MPTPRPDRRSPTWTFTAVAAAIALLMAGTTALASTETDVPDRGAHTSTQAAHDSVPANASFDAEALYADEATPAQRAELLEDTASGTSTGGVTADAGPSAPVCVSKVPHAPIVITADEGPNGFILGEDPTTGHPIYRPGSGVVGGSGTAEDPYVIAGWCLGAHPVRVNPDTHVRNGILIANTNAHVVVEDNVVDPTLTENPLGFHEGLDHGANGIVIDGASHVTVRSNHVADHRSNFYAPGDPGGVGIWATQADDLVLENNTVTNNAFDGIRLDTVPESVLRANTVTQNKGWGVFSDDSPAPTLTGNAVVENGVRGVDLRDAPRSVVTANALDDNDFEGLHLLDAPDSVVRQNTIIGNAADGFSLGGMLLYGAPHSVVEHNTIDDNLYYGLILGFSPDIPHSDTDFRNNNVRDNEHWGIRTANFEKTVMAGNNIEGNGDWRGLWVENVDNQVSEINATGNWWGAANGPSSIDDPFADPTVDDCTGTEADGDGQVIYTEVEICFDPWLSGPNPDAGAG